MCVKEGNTQNTQKEGADERSVKKKGEGDPRVRLGKLEVDQVELF